MPLTTALLILAVIAAWMATDFSRDASIAPLFATAGLLLATLADVVRTLVRRQRAKTRSGDGVADQGAAPHSGESSETGERVKTKTAAPAAEEEPGGELLTVGMLVSVLWFAAFLALVYLLGIVIGGTIFAALFLVGWGRRPIWQGLAFALPLGTAVHLGFSVLLGLRLYAGVWPFL